MSNAAPESPMYCFRVGNRIWDRQVTRRRCKYRGRSVCTHDLGALTPISHKRVLVTHRNSHIWASRNDKRLRHSHFHHNTVVAMGRVIRNQRKGRGSIFTANTRLNKAPAQFRTLDYVRPTALPPRKLDSMWNGGLIGYRPSAMDTFEAS